MSKKIKLFFLILVNMISISCFVFENQNSIAKIENNKIYLKPGFVQVANNGIFIQVGGELHAIESLKLDDKGIFFEDHHTIIVGDCSLCGDATVFGVCLNGNCPSNRKD